MVAFGVESGSDQVLEKSKKGITVSAIRSAFKAVKNAKLKSYMMLIFGLPFETEETICETIDLMMDADPDYVTITNLIPFPGTEVLKMAEEGVGGLRLLNSDWSHYDKQFGSPIELETVNASRLKHLQAYAYARFYLRPSKIIHLMEFASPSGILKMLKANLASRT